MSDLKPAIHEAMYTPITASSIGSENSTRILSVDTGTLDDFLRANHT